ncbi:MAG: TonB-dependent receptor, partial [Gammaproteobacteria bacterium]|nr:TonB-dependent receptor [Gammaproteobacteria bacterium]
ANTLTLLNGRRISAYGSSQGTSDPFVDIAAIPINTIARIEILKDGASAIYGADAVAGVVNIILKDTFEGLEIGGGALSTSKNDHAEWEGHILGGWSNGATNIISSLTYFYRDELLSRERDFSADADLTRNGGFNRRSSGSSPATVFLRQEFRPVPDPECPAAGSVNNIMVIVPGIIELCQFNFQTRTSRISESKRWSYFGSIEHVFANDLEIFAELFTSHNKGVGRFAPAPTFATPLPTITGFPLVLADHPNNPFGQDVEISYRILDAGDRVFEFESRSYRALAGARGSNDRLDWEFGFATSASLTEQRTGNQVFTEAFQDALLGNGGPNGGQYYNPFGLEPINDPAVIDAFSTEQKFDTDATEHVVDALVNLPLFRLPGGEAVLAAGVQYRSLAIEETQDQFSAIGAIFGSVSSNTIDESRNVRSVFVEAQLPLLDNLEAQLAVRYERYNDFDSSTNPKLAVRWDILPSLAMRASYATSFRPPTFRELFDDSPETVTFFQDSKRCPLTGDASDCSFFPYASQSVGNRDLGPEEGTSRFVGLIWQPTWLIDGYVTLDFWEIDHTDRVIFVPGQTFIDDFDVDTQFVSRFDPTPAEEQAGIPGRIDFVTSAPINADRVTTNGVDLEISVSFEGTLGLLRGSLMYTYLNDWKIEESLALGFSENRAGDEALPRHRGNVRLSWHWGTNGVSAIGHYVGKYFSPLDRVVNGIETNRPVVIRDWITLDLQYVRSFPTLRDAELAIGCQNCGDADPPRYNYTFNGENLHDGRGAIAYLRWTQPL